MSSERKIDGAIGAWSLQEAKARLSEVIRQAKDRGPQQVTIHGRAAVMVISIEEYRRLKGNETGEALIDALRACPDPDFDFQVVRGPLPVRDVAL